jgi:uncharacterized protein DUF4124
MAMAGCALSVHGQQIYKWVDDKGVTQYTTTPPPGGKAQTIKTAPAPAAPATRTWQEQEIEFRARQVERAEARHKQEQAQKDAAWRRAACATAQQDLRALKEQRPVYRQDEKGKRQYLDDPQRAEAERTARGFIDRECSK